MSIIPDWAPNLHPLVVHFPIALLFVAALMDTIGLVFKNEPMWRNSAFLLYVFGTLAAVGAFFAGRAAADSVYLATEANALLTDHADMATYMVYFFGGYALLRIIFFFAKMETRTGVRAIMYFLGIGGLVLVWATADRGGELVFKHGVGVAVVGEVSVEPTDFTDASGTSAPQNNDKGGWSWKPTKAAAWIASVSTYGTEGGVTTSMQDGGSYGDVLALTAVDGSPVMFTFDTSMQSVQLDSRLNLDGFEGSVMFLHHVIDAQNYSFVSVSKGDMKIGRSENGDLYLLADKPFSPTGWHSYRMVSDKTHFRGYADQKLIVHGHGDDPGSGFVGIRLNGTGTVLLDFVQTVSLRGEGMDNATETTPDTPATADTTAHKH